VAEDRPIIIKRIKKSGGAHHGGAWKVAYADFVTAMMAFFLLLWLLNAVTEEQKKGIAQYFKPTIAPPSQQSQEAVLNGQPAIMQAIDGASAANASLEDAEDDAEDVPKGPEEKSDDQQNPVPANAGQQGEKPVDVKEAQEVVAKAEQQQFEDVKKKIEQQIQQDPGLADLKNNIDIQQTPEGLLIQLLDKDKVSMFPSGSASMNERSRQLLSLVAHVVAPLDNKLSISGHTDATPYQGRADYSNWELSTDRANAARRALVNAGVDTKRIDNISGRADTDPKIKNDPLSPENRRISIVLLRDKPIGTTGMNAPAPVLPEAPAPAPAPAAAPAEPSAPPPDVVPSNPGIPESITHESAAPASTTH
jgi:chemotaxis protein MotB